MAGLLETIAKRLLGGGESKKTYTNTQRSTTKTAYVKPVVQQPKQDAVTAFDRTFKRERTNREVE